MVTNYLFLRFIVPTVTLDFSLVLSAVRDCSEPQDSCRLKCCGQVALPSLNPKATFYYDKDGTDVWLVQHDFSRPQCTFTGSNGEFECVTESVEKCHYQNFTCVVKLGLSSFSAPISIPLLCKSLFHSFILYMYSLLPFYLPCRINYNIRHLHVRYANVTHDTWMHLRLG